MGRVNVVKYMGETYRIPEMWLAGWLRSGRSVQAAVAFWHEQEMMEREFRRQRGLAVAA